MGEVRKVVDSSNINLPSETTSGLGVEIFIYPICFQDFDLFYAPWGKYLHSIYKMNLSSVKDSGE